MLPLPPENSGCNAQRAGHGGAMFKRCNTANAVFRGNPQGWCPFSRISALLVARLAMLNHTPRALTCTKTVTSGITNNFETASRISGNG